MSWLLLIGVAATVAAASGGLVALARRPRPRGPRDGGARRVDVPRRVRELTLVGGGAAVLTAVVATVALAAGAPHAKAKAASDAAGTEDGPRTASASTSEDDGLAAPATLPRHSSGATSSSQSSGDGGATVGSGGS
jgi:hypothetical protein